MDRRGGRRTDVRSTSDGGRRPADGRRRVTAVRRGGARPHTPRRAARDQYARAGRGLTLAALMPHRDGLIASQEYSSRTKFVSGTDNQWKVRGKANELLTHSEARSAKSL